MRCHEPVKFGNRLIEDALSDREPVCKIDIFLLSCASE